MKTLTIGAGEVGQAVHEIVKGYHDSTLRDKKPEDLEGIEVLHICFPESPKFKSHVRKYIKQYRPAVTVINSSVQVGTTEKIGEGIVYSPVRGRHRPSLSGEMKHFKKVVAGRDASKVGKVMDYFGQCGIEVYGTYDVKGVELCKLLSNIHMGLEIAWAQESARIMKRFKCNPTTYKMWEQSYAEGYLRLRQTHLMRPIMDTKPIGGHCILECTKILGDQYDSLAFDFIRGSNEKAILEAKRKGN